jgi:phage FluMu protein gp41
MANEYIYELRDTTDPETYYTLGLFTGLEKIEEWIEKVDALKGPLSKYTNGERESEELSIVKRAVNELNKDAVSVCIYLRETDHQWLWSTLPQKSN